MVMPRHFPLATARSGVASQETAAMRYRGPLDWLNFFLADVKGALGPYIGIYLLTEQHWNQAQIGFLATVAGIVGLIIHAPLGAFIDATYWKRAAVVAGVGVLTISALAIAITPSFPVVLTAQTMMAVAGAVFGPAIAAITLGILGSHGLAYRMGRNAAFDHAGNVAVAALAGAVGWWFSQSAVFYLVPIFSLLAASAVLSIPARAIDHAQARGLDPLPTLPCKPGRDREGERGSVGRGSAERPSGWHVLVTCKPLLVFAACVTLFHFANAPMLPLVGQKLALAHKGAETALMSACIIAAQLVMLPMALLVGAKADAWGRKPIFLAAFAILPIRGVLYTLSDDREWLIAVQLLDGVGAGIFGALAPLIVADLMRGTGRYNVSLGAVATVQGIGASLSNMVAGMIVVQAGYNVAFLTLAAVAAVAFATFLFAMPETGTPRGAEPDAGAPRIKLPGARPAAAAPQLKLTGDYVVGATSHYGAKS
jgi:MFS family permease